MDLKFLFDWNEAARKPRRTTAAMFSITAPAFSALSYFFITDRHTLASITIGVLGGVGFAAATHSHARAQITGREPAIGASRSSVPLISRMFRMLLVFGGAGIAIIGAATLNVSLSVAGVLLGLLGVVLTMLRRQRRTP